MIDLKEKKGSGRLKIRLGITLQLFGGAALTPIAKPAIVVKAVTMDAEKL
jgi:hypothetical protein